MQLYSIYYDLIEVFKMIKGRSEVEYTPFFKLEQIGRTIIEAITTN